MGDEPSDLRLGHENHIDHRSLENIIYSNGDVFCKQMGH